MSWELGIKYVQIIAILVTIMVQTCPVQEKQVFAAKNV